MITRTLLTLAICLGFAAPSWAAVAFGSIGAAGSGTTTASPAYPASIAANDLLVLCVANKYPTNGPSTPSGWTAPANNQGTADPGNGPGADVGATYATVFYKVATGSESGTLALTITGGNSTYAWMMRYTNATGQWLAAAANGGDATHGANWSAAMGSDPGITAGDMIVACSARNEGSINNASAEAITASGLTMGTEAERGDNGTSAGDNVMGVVSDHVVSSGTASGNVTYTFTSVTSSAGGTAILRIREDNAAATSIQSNTGFLGAIIP